MKRQRGQLEIMLALGATLMLSLAGTYILWQSRSALAKELDQARAALATEKVNGQVVTKFVDRIVQIPGPVTIRDRIVHGLCNPTLLPSPPSSPSGTTPDTVAGQSDEAGDAAVSLHNAAINQEQLRALLAVVKPQANRPSTADQPVGVRRWPDR